MENIEFIERISHFEHWGSYIGFGYQQKVESRAFFEDLIQEPGLLEVHGEGELVKKILKNHGLGYECIFKNNALISAYPIIHIGEYKTFTSRHIYVYELKDAPGTEAIVKGDFVRDGLSLSFYATDYAEHSSRYKEERLLGLSIAAFAYEMKPAVLPKSFSPGFVGIVPLENQGGVDPCLYSCVGDVLFCEKRFDEIGGDGYIARLKLVNSSDGYHGFDLTCWINDENNKCKTLRKGMKVSTTLWLQGRVR